MMFERLKLTDLAIHFLDLLLISFLFFDIGFSHNDNYVTHKLVLLPTIVLILIAFNLYKYYGKEFYPSVRKRSQYNLIILGSLVVINLVVVIFNYQDSFLHTFYTYRNLLEYGLLFYYFIRISFLMRLIYRLYFNPFILFVGSFIIVILIGTFFLMLPSATIEPISFEDALFTATSAVCVTGLLSVDSATQFTLFGQTIMMVLIQLGGLGMLTFTSFFAYFFKSGSSFKESLFMKNVLGDDQLNNVMKTTFRIVIFTVCVEAVGTFFIYDATKHLEIEHHLFFSVFHAISAYCNGGFSTIENGLRAQGLQFNYYLHWVIMFLIIFGGLGFFISFNFIRYIKQFFINLFEKGKKKSIVRLITLNTKIVGYTTVILLIGGAVSIFITEYNTVLTDHNTLFGKWTTAAFSSVTARTTGFNIVDYSHFTLPGLLIMILLMWIGASPASTGGGIKTSTFALGILNVFSIARNKRHIEIGTRRVDSIAVKRAFAIMMISLIAIGISILLLLIFDPKFTLMEVAFEVFSAFGTVGLSLGITDSLSTPSQYVIIFTMFFGRIGLINLMSGILRKLRTQSYEYPKENILIN